MYHGIQYTTVNTFWFNFYIIIFTMDCKDYLQSGLTIYIDDKFVCMMAFHLAELKNNQYYYGKSLEYRLGE